MLESALRRAARRLPMSTETGRGKAWQDHRDGLRRDERRHYAKHPPIWSDTRRDGKHPSVTLGQQDAEPWPRVCVVSKR